MAKKNVCNNNNSTATLRSAIVHQIVINWISFWQDKNYAMLHEILQCTYIPTQFAILYDKYHGI